MSQRDYGDVPMGEIDIETHEVPEDTDLEAYTGKSVQDVLEDHEPNTPPEKLDTEWVAFEELVPNDWNPNYMPDHRKDLLILSVLDNGWTQPIVARPDNTIIDGEHRWTLAQEPELAECEELTPEGVPAGHVPVHYIDIEKEQAMIATYQQNYARGEHDATKMGELVEGLQEESDDAFEFTATRMGVTEGELELLLPDSDLSEDATELWDTPWDDDISHGSYTDRMAFDMLKSEAQLVRHIFGADGTARPLVKLCRFIIETDLYEEVEGVPEPDFDRIPPLDDLNQPENDSNTGGDSDE